MKASGTKKSKIKKSLVDKSIISGRYIYHIDDLKIAKALLEANKKMNPNLKFCLFDFI